MKLTTIFAISSLLVMLGACGEINTFGLQNTNDLITNTKISFDSGITYDAPHGFCVSEPQTYEDQAKGFGVFVSCSKPYDRARLLTVAHYPIDPASPPLVETMIQAAGMGAKITRVVNKDGVVLARLRGEFLDQKLQNDFNRMIVQRGGYVIMANLYARENAANTDFRARQILAQVLKDITVDPAQVNNTVSYLPTDPMIRPKIRP